METPINGELTPKYEVNEEQLKRLERIFTYHAPKEDQPQRYHKIRSLAHYLAIDILENCPDSRERSLAITKIEEAVFWANASIARGE